MANRNNLALGDQTFELSANKYVDFGELNKEMAQVQEELRTIVQAQYDKAKGFLVSMDRQLEPIEGLVDDLEQRIECLRQEWGVPLTNAVTVPKL